jgi:N-acetylglucosamine-6-phosphate deacetylase
MHAVPPVPPVLLRARRALLPGGLQPAEVLVSEGVVAAVGPLLDAPGVPVVEVDLLAPGFVDLHVHAVDGCGAVGPAPDVPGLSRALARRGVTSFLATTVTAPVEELLALLSVRVQGGARLAGLHLEGPWLSPDHVGAQPVAHLAPPSLPDLERLIAAGPPVLLTVAPELPGGLEVVTRAAQAGVVVSLGHSGATYDETLAAVAAGARHVTHCFNAMRPLHHREPGLAGAALDLPDVTVEVIADGVHLHPATVRLVWRAAGAARVCLVSDAVELDLPEARSDGTVTRRPDGTLAGSRTGLDGMVRNLVGWGVPLADALTMASTTPARVLGRSGEIAVGAPADLVALDDDLQVVRTTVDGVVVWQR